MPAQANAYVAEAKRQLFGRVGIDILAGPTEIVVITDESATPELVAADLLGQAEHGPDSPAGLVSLSHNLAEAVLAAIDRLLIDWPTADVSERAWRDRGWVAVVESEEEAVAYGDKCAPEHLEVHVAKSREDRYLERLSNYKNLFLGAEGCGRLRRQSHRYEPRSSHRRGGALHGWTLGWQVPEDADLPAVSTGGRSPNRAHCRGNFLRRGITTAA